MDWRHLTGAVLLVLALVVGGFAYEATRPCDGALTAAPSEEVPPNATVTPVADLPDNEHVRRVVEKAIDDDGRVSVALTGPELRTVRRQLSSYPTFGNSWYVRQESETVAVTDWCNSGF
jgi:hypothetical protein